MADHAWCHDIDRDAAVRAAEDGRQGPLPTLEEAIVRPFTEAPERSVPVSKTGEGQSGVREQRVSLSLKRMGELISERDAAIRELLAEKVWRDNLAMQRNEIRDERDALKARVAELEAASGGEQSVSAGTSSAPAVDSGQSSRIEAASGGGLRSGYGRWPIGGSFWRINRKRRGRGRGEMGHAWCRDIDRDAAVRAAEDNRVLAASKKLIEVDQEAALRGFDTTTFQRLWISAIARVLGLELARPPRSKCDNPGDGSIPSPGILASPALVEAHQQIATLTDERDAAIREREDSVAFWQGELRSRTAERDAARARVAELEARTSTAGESSCAAPAASGLEQQGVSSGTSGASAGDSGQNGRLEAAPPQPRGWLTGEEKAAVRWAMSEGFDEEVLCNLLARSSPPEVVRPKLQETGIFSNEVRDAEWVEALAAAGVAVKEVPRG
jgi:BMFP domain-containing protein YqiC